MFKEFGVTFLENHGTGIPTGLVEIAPQREFLSYFFVMPCTSCLLQVPVRSMSQCAVPVSQLCAWAHWLYVPSKLDPVRVALIVNARKECA